MSSKWWTSPNHALDMARFIRTSVLNRAICGAASGECRLAEILRPGRIEAGFPRLLVPARVVPLGQGTYRGVVPRLAGVPGLGPLLLGPCGVVIYGRISTIVVAG
jgi:hypothetical protein